MFGLEIEEVSLEVYLWEGSFWAKVKPGLETFGLILGLYVGMHDASAHLKHDFKRASSAVAHIVQSVANSKVLEVQGFSPSDDYWKHQFGQYRQLVTTSAKPKINEETETSASNDSAPGPQGED